MLYFGIFYLFEISTLEFVKKYLTQTTNFGIGSNFSKDPDPGPGPFIKC